MAVAEFLQEYVEYVVKTTIQIKTVCSQHFTHAHNLF